VTTAALTFFVRNGMGIRIGNNIQNAGEKKAIKGGKAVPNWSELTE